jgi:hyaluronan synthase
VTAHPGHDELTELDLLDLELDAARYGAIGSQRPTGTAVQPGPVRRGLTRAEQARLLPPGLPARERWTRIGAATMVVLVCALFLVVAVGYLVTHRWNSGLMALYTVVVTTHVLSRFVLAAGYRPPPDLGHEPTVAIVVPAFNESVAVRRTIDACMAVNYDQERLRLIVVNDGSSDDTWQHMIQAASRYPRGRVECLDLGVNRGKRAAMAAGIRAAADAEILVFVDSDSMPAPQAIRQIVQGFADPKVGAISGVTHVRNAARNTLTRMQMARYFVSFRLLKSAESVVGAVACCSGCFAAYRTSAVLPVLDAWENQRFLGVECTYGDDRALTNMLLRRRWITIFDSSAQAWTDAPERYRQFFRQQLRWKKSWSREGPLLLSHIWRSRFRAFPFVLMGTLSALLSPFVLLLNLAQPAISGQLPVVYLLGLFLVSMAYALFYRALRNDGLWTYACLGTYFYIATSPQLWWAMLRIRDGSWGTRPSLVGSSAARTPSRPSMTEANSRDTSGETA